MNNTITYENILWNLLEDAEYLNITINGNLSSLIDQVYAEHTGLTLFTYYEQAETPKNMTPPMTPPKTNPAKKKYKNSTYGCNCKLCDKRKTTT